MKRKPSFFIHWSCINENNVEFSAYGSFVCSYCVGESFRLCVGSQCGIDCAQINCKRSSLKTPVASICIASDIFSQSFNIASNF